MKLSVVSTVYKSSSFIAEFYDRISSSLIELGVESETEIIFVNDGSPDDSLEILLHLSQLDARIKIIDLTKNCGHHAAIVAGLEHSCGENVFLIDIDLEEPPETIVDFYNRISLDNNGLCDVFYGVQKSRDGSVIKKYGGKIFYKLFQYLSNVEIDENVLTVRIMSRRYLNALLSHKEKEVYLAGLFSITGFGQKPVEIDKKSRQESSYSFTHRVKLFIQAIVSFSSLPLVFCFYLGSAISLFTFIYSLFLGIRVISGEFVLEGWTSLIISIWFLSGVILMALGIIGIYLSKIFNEVKNRPLYLVKNIHEKK